MQVYVYNDTYAFPAEHELYIASSPEEAADMLRSRHPGNAVDINRYELVYILEVKPGFLFSAQSSD